MLPVRAHTEAGAPADILVTGPARPGIMDADVEQVHARLVLGVEPAHIGQRPESLHDHGDAMQRVPRLMKGMPAQTVAPAPKCLSKAFTSSPAMT